MAELCACIYNLINFEVEPEPYANLKRCSKSYILKCIRLSDLPATLVKVNLRHRCIKDINFSKLSNLVAYTDGRKYWNKIKNNEDFTSFIYWWKELQSNA